MSSHVALNQFNFHESIENAVGTSLVFFTMADCASCHYWEILLTQYKNENPLINLFYIDAAMDQALTEEFEVFHLPALFLYVDGHFQSDIQCEAKIDILDLEIRKVMQAPARECP